MRQLGFHGEPHLCPGDFGSLVCPQAGSHPAGAQLEAFRYLNGIDTVGYDPATDPNIYAHYSREDRANKAVNKQKLQERLCMEQNPDLPLVGMVTRLVSHKGWIW